MFPSKQQMVDELSEYNTGYSKAEIKQLEIDELRELYAEFHGANPLFPNGRDFDSEDEDGI